MEEKKILEEIFNKLYKRDVDYSVNIFLCGANTNRKDTIRNMLHIEFMKDARFNSVYPEHIFASLYLKGKHNLLELEDDLAKYVDVIVLPLESIGTYCELGAFAVNKSLLPKIIAINEQKYKKSKSFIKLGPIDLIKKNNSKNLIYYKRGQENEIITKIIERVRSKRYEKKISYDFENLFNLSRYILYLIAFFQPISIESLKKLIKKLDIDKMKNKYIDSSIHILIQKKRIEHDMDRNDYSLSDEGHRYVYEELLNKLKVKKEFTSIRCEIINERYRPKKWNMSKDKDLLV